MGYKVNVKWLDYVNPPTYTLSLESKTDIKDFCNLSDSLIDAYWKVALKVAFYQIKGVEL